VQDSLFEIPGADARESRIVAAKWGGSKSKQARAKCRAMLPWACRHCGGMISPDDPETSWDAGHREGNENRAGGSTDGMEPEHSRCNRSEGGKVGAAITNSQRRPAPGATIQRERTPQWW
jgi:hypothetical protein